METFTVLVVEDNDPIVTLIKRAFLEDTRVKIITASTIPEAVELIDDNISLVLLDGMLGSEPGSSIMSRLVGIRVILIPTENNLSDLQKAARDLGVDTTDCPKPFRSIVIKRHVYDVLGINPLPTD